MRLVLLAAAFIIVTTAAAIANDSDLGFGPINTSVPDVRAVCKDTTLAIVARRVESGPDTRESRALNGVNVKTNSGLFLSAYGGGDEAIYFSALRAGQHVQVCMTSSDLSRRGGASNRFCVNSEYRFYNYDLERVYVFGNNGCHA